jgi:hypothetical protein
MAYALDKFLDRWGAQAGIIIKYFPQVWLVVRYHPSSSMFHRVL